MSVQGGVFPDTVAYHEAVRAYNADPSPANSERVRLAEAEYERATMERVRSAQEALSARVTELSGAVASEQSSSSAPVSSGSRLSRTKALLRQVNEALFACRKHNQELHALLKDNVAHKRSLTEMRASLRVRKQELMGSLEE